MVSAVQQLCKRQYRGGLHATSVVVVVNEVVKFNLRTAGTLSAMLCLALACQEQ
jgi:hypothetical protein